MNKRIVSSLIVTITISTLSIFQKSAFSVSYEIKYEDLNKPEYCILSPFEILKNKETEFVINNQDAYKTILSYRKSDSVCKNFAFLEIDFSEKTLLGKYTFAAGCSINFIRHVFRDNSSKEIIYSINVSEIGRCEKAVYSMNWILIPKIPSDYKVKFEVVKTFKEETRAN